MLPIYWNAGKRANVSRTLLPSSQVTADLIAAELRADIQRGLVPPGAPLRQEDIARRFEVSRIPVREALRALESDGLVEVLPNRGAYVIELTAAQIEEITELRVLIEVDLLRLALARASEDDLRSISSAAKAAEAASTTPAWSVADNEFHRALYLAASRPRQLGLAMSLRHSLERYWAIYGKLPMKRGEWLRDHARLVRAYMNRDAQIARRELAGHIRRAGQFLIAMHEQNARLSAERIRSNAVRKPAKTKRSESIS
jgi:DNA-binding GntR family transcriptional regulator